MTAALTQPPNVGIELGQTEVAGQQQLPTAGDSGSRPVADGGDLSIE